MPETEPVIEQEQLRVPELEKHAQAPAETFDQFTANAEHGSPGHVCTAECQHTQTEADNFADGLFAEATTKNANHGEAGHVCDANCKHTQAEADNFADGLFEESSTSNHSHEDIRHGEKGHVCTAECQHTQAEADSFADALFDNAKEQAAHGEKGHVCDANCKHTQVEADNFADGLFAEAAKSQEATPPSKTDTQAYEQAAKTTDTKEVNDYSNLDARVQDMLRTQIADTLSNETVDTTITVKSESAEVDSVQQQIPIKGASEDPINRTNKKYNTNPEHIQTEHSPAQHQNSETTPPETRQNLETRLDDSDNSTTQEIFDNSIEVNISPDNNSGAENKIRQTSGQLENISVGIHEDVVRPEGDEEPFIDLEQDALVDNDILETEPVSPEDGIDVSVADHAPDSANAPKEDGNSTAEVLEQTETIESAAEIPSELEPIKQLLPAITEHVANDANKAQSLREVELAIQELLELLPSPDDLTTKNANMNEQILEQLESLSLQLGISTDELLNVLEIGAENLESSQLRSDILHGLKKWVSIEYSLEFSSAKSQSATSTNSARDPRTLGQLILSTLQNTAAASVGLSSA